METILPVKEPEEEPIERSFATVGAVYADGVSLIFDGETEPTEKHYLCNTNVFFQAGDRVRILADSGTYVVEYVVGAPRQDRLVGIPAGGTAAQVLTKDADEDFAASWQAVPHEIPASGTVGYVLTKTSDGFSWQAVPVELPTGGTADQVLTKNSATNYDVKWAAVPSEIPATGTVGYVLTKTSTGFAWQAVPTEIPATGTTGYVLTKQSSGFGWEAAPHEIPATGTTGHVLTKTSGGFGWEAAPHELPTGGSNGQVLLKNGTTAYAVQWGSIPPAAKIRNPASSSYPDSDSYVIQFRTVNTYGDGAKQLQFRMGTSATWTTLANV